MARFADVSNGQVDKLLEHRHSPNTKMSTSLAWRVFEAYTQAKNINLDLLCPVLGKAMTNKSAQMKVWPLLLACLATGAVHIQVAHNYGTEAFLQ